MKYKEGTLERQMRVVAERTPGVVEVQGHQFGLSLFEVVGADHLAPRDTKRLAILGLKTQPTRRKGR